MSASSRSWMVDVVRVARGRSRREERIRVPEDRPKVDATYVTVLNSLWRSPPISVAECFFLKECEFAKLDGRRRGGCDRKSSSRGTHPCPGRSWLPRFLTTPKTRRPNKNGAWGMGLEIQCFPTVPPPPWTPGRNENPPPKYRLGKYQKHIGKLFNAYAKVHRRRVADATSLRNESPRGSPAGENSSRAVHP